MGTPKNLNIISKISADLDLIRFDQNDTLAQITETFYSIMRKYGIKKYTLTDGLGLMENSEWSMCYTYFMDKLVKHFDLLDYFAQLPEDLKHY